MACYKFYQDKKCTVLERTFFTVEAASEEAAIRCAGQLGKGDLYAAEMQQEGIAIDESETLYDSMEELSVNDNGDQPTVEIFAGTPRKGHLIAREHHGAAVANMVAANGFSDDGTHHRLAAVELRPRRREPGFCRACEAWWSGPPKRIKSESGKSMPNEPDNGSR